MRRKIGFLFQNAALFDSISVGENVAFPLRRHTSSADRGNHGAGDAEARVGRPRERLRQDAGGALGRHAQARRPGARDGARSADLLVDEPSAGLDPITADEIDTLLLDLKERGGTTLIVVTHNIPSAKRLGDELVMLHEGRIIARGTAAELEQSSEPMVRAFMSSQHSG